MGPRREREAGFDRRNEGRRSGKSGGGLGTGMCVRRVENSSEGSLAIFSLRNKKSEQRRSTVVGPCGWAGGCGRRRGQRQARRAAHCSRRRAHEVPQRAVLLRGPWTRRAMHGCLLARKPTCFPGGLGRHQLPDSGSERPDGTWGGWGTRVTTAKGALNYR